MPFTPISSETRPRRRMNLGGTPSSTSHTRILADVHAQRAARAEHKRRADAALRVQSWWRGVQARKTVRLEAWRTLRSELGVSEDRMDVDAGLSLTGLRSLMILAHDDAALGFWTTRMQDIGFDKIFDLSVASSWTVLVRVLALRLVQSVSRDPSSPNAPTHLALLLTILASPTAHPHRSRASREIAAYLVQNEMYDFVGTALRRIPVPTPKSKSKPASSSSSTLPPSAALLIDLALAPLPIFSTLPDSTLYSRALANLIAHVFVVPLLPNRVPLNAITRLSSGVIGASPTLGLEVLQGWESYIFARIAARARAETDTTPTDKETEALVNLTAHFTLLVSPYYPRLPPKSIQWALNFQAGVFARIAAAARSAPGLAGVFDAPVKGKAKAEERTSIKVEIVDSFDFESGNDTRRGKTVSVDPRTLKRVSKIVAPASVDVILAAGRKSADVQKAYIEYLLALIAVWPTQRENVLTTVLALTEGRIVRELYRGCVRGCGLGRDAGAGASRGDVFDPKYAAAWPAMVLLAELYAQALVTMGDDEFFSSSSSTSSIINNNSNPYANSPPSSSSARTLGSSGGGRTALGIAPAVVAASSTAAPRNPLTLDEVTAFARQMLNVAFPLFWTEDQGRVRGKCVWGLEFGVGADAGAGAGMGNVGTSTGATGGGWYTWEVVRERVTRCLVAIHARDSRKRFVQPDGWLVSSHVDMKQFVEAAILEETHLSSPDYDGPENIDSGDGATATPNPTSTRGGGGNTHAHARAKRAIAALSPCLGVLNNIPFAIPFEIRVNIFRHFVLADVAKVYGRDATGPGGLTSLWRSRDAWDFRNKTRIRVRRGRVAQDGFDRLAEADLKRPVEITFVDQFGQEEAGIDGGGVFKEFFTDLCKEVFDTDRGLWLANTKNELYPNPHSYATEAHSLNWYRFIGRVLGKAMYDGILVDVAFAGFFLARWLGRQSFLDDLTSLDPELYKGLVFLKHYQGNPEDLALNFTIAVDELGTTKNVELVPNGSDISVTKANRLEYITLVSHYRLKKQIQKQSEAFFDGLSEMIDPRWIRMFNQQEVQILIGGVNAPVDLDDLREHTNYGGLYDDRHPVIVAFWKVVNTFDQEQRRALLRFVTSCSRPPLLGFKELVPNFSIRDAGTDEHRLPTSSTCVNLLKLPLYPNERIMREKILQSIMSNSGFDLS